MSLRVGSLIYCCDSGLGVLAREFVKYGIITDPLVVLHAHHENHLEWYAPETPKTPIRPFNTRLAQEHCSKCDVMLFLETPFDWSLPGYCRQHGVKTAICPMYECYPKDKCMEAWNLIICPSLLDLNYFPSSIFIPVPVDVPWRQRTRAEVFVHNAGHGGLRGRNGSKELLEALPLVKSPASLILRSQSRTLVKTDNTGHAQIGNVNVCASVGTVDRQWLYDAGDAFIWPDKFDGLSLPLQEARASGMLVLASDRFPANTWLPREPLIPVSRYDRASVSPRCLEFDEAIVEPKAIAETIDAWYGRDLAEYSLQGREWAEANSWAVLGPKYKEALEGLI